MSKDLNPTKALAFRITHRDNLPWILANGLHCASAQKIDPKFVAIGNADLILKRRSRAVGPPHGGFLSDYVPFYFTPFSPMMYNIKTGWAGITQRRSEEIAILVSSIFRFRELGLPFVFTDRHAYLQAAQFFDYPARLDHVDWGILQRRDFRTDPNDPAKIERYQAEALVRDHVPVAALLGIGCYDEPTRQLLSGQAQSLGAKLPIRVSPGWYF